MSEYNRIRWRSQAWVLVLSLCVLFYWVTPVNASSKPIQPNRISNNLRNEATINTLNPGATYKLNYKKYNLVKGKSILLKVLNLPSGYKVTYKSQNTSIAKVNNRGNVTGVKNGTVTVTAIVKYRSRVLRRLTCKVTVGSPAVSVVIPESKINLTVKEKKDLNTIVKPKYSTESPKYSSSNPSVVSVTSSGIIKGIKPGTAIITVTISNKKSDTCIVTVAKKTATPQKKNKK